MADVTASAEYSSIAARLAALEQKAASTALAARLYRILLFGAQNAFPTVDPSDPAFSGLPTILESSSAYPAVSLYEGLFGFKADGEADIRDYVGTSGASTGLASRLFSKDPDEVSRFAMADSSRSPLAQLVFGRKSTVTSSTDDPALRLNGSSFTPHSFWGGVFGDGMSNVDALNAHHGSLFEAIFGDASNVDELGIHSIYGLLKSLEARVAHLEAR